MSFVFIDESGDLGVGGSKYLVLAALIIEDYSPLDRIVKNVRRNKFRKVLSGITEIKGNNLQDEVTVYLLNSLNEVKNVKVMYVLLEKKKVFSKYLKNDHHKLYNYVAGKLARNLSFNSSKVEIRIDKSKGKQLLRDDFNEYFKKCLRPEEASKITLIVHSHSHSWIGLQFADLLAWSCFQKFEHNNSKFVDLLKIDQEVVHVW